MPPPPFQGALKDGFGETAVACDMAEPCKFPSLNRKVDLAPHPAVGLVLQVEMQISSSDLHKKRSISISNDPIFGLVVGILLQVLPFVSTPTTLPTSDKGPVIRTLKKF